MSVTVILRLVELVRSKGVVVTFEPGWETRGNGQTSAYEGLIEHHTAIPASYANPMPGLRVVRDGRPDLAGPLANLLGPFDGSLRVIAAHPANHAGASGGPSMGPLPVSRLFNPRVLGVEFDYAGNSPMSPEQYRTAKVLAWAVGQMFGDVERCRAHRETSIEGKWDPGWAPGQTINMHALRSEAANLQLEGDDMQADERRALFGIEMVLAPGGIIRTMIEGLVGALGKTEELMDGKHIGTVVAESAAKMDALVQGIGLLADRLDDVQAGELAPAVVREQLVELLKGAKIQLPQRSVGGEV